jgi:hypothetical protein
LKIDPPEAELKALRAIVFHNKKDFSNIHSTALNHQ